MYLVAAPAFTVKKPEASEVVMAPALAVILRSPAPAMVGVMVTPSTRPPAEMTALTVPAKAFEVRDTVPVYVVTRLPIASTALTRTLKGVPAVLAAADSGVVPPVIVTEKAATAAP